MKKIIIKGMTVGLALTGFAWAATPSQSTNAGDTNPTGQTSTNTEGTTGTSGGSDAIGATNAPISGTVESIDRTSNRVRVRDSAGNVTEHTVGSGTTFTANGKNGNLSKLQVGDSVTFPNINTTQDNSTTR